ncbi:MAG: Rrf2 family transcriptional regulator [Alphaproteobacteria bacterium]|nr:Rrf2 family transcriptional regulator [Alphaproteobacteria bacterium]MBU6473778.1 Rrf2 family transcriptional regulator [Alphaproteobacteria bacterium]MDE2014428.1 Rrf2 family transcriptional regulator [Alphaproteobacteria bacterium]MDE2075086.1 Rrf2 family transcriptional regulator [Alphaproteobacteria bacterium]
MRLTTYTDYGLRLLIYVALKEGELATIQEVADAYAISKNHLMKVAYHLGQYGHLETVRGRGGGLRLARSPERIRLGEVIRHMEDDFTLVECFEPSNTCRITRACRLKGILGEALKAYLAVLDRYTLADLIDRQSALDTILLNRAAR